MRDWEKRRASEISEYILVTHVVCLLIFLMIILSFYNLPIGSIKGNYPVNLSFIIVIFFAFIVIYVIRNVLPRIFDSNTRTDEVLLLIIVFPLSFIYLWHSHDFIGAKLLIIVPVIIAATTFGKNTGSLVAFMAGALLFALDYKLSGDQMSAAAFQTNLILTSVIVLLAWLVGGLMEVERKTQQDLIRLADFDQLTGLYNHRFLQERLMLSLQEASSTGSQLTLVLLDINQLKYFNSHYSYQSGDQILSTIGQLLHNEIKEPCYAARYGSDEFMLVFPGLDKNEVLIRMKDLKDSLIRHITDFLSKETAAPSLKPFTLTEGLASYPADGCEVVPLIRAAENDLFRTKYSKGRSHLYQSVLSEIGSLKVKEAFTYLQTFVTLINAKDRYTFGHSERVMSYALAMADRMGLDEEKKDSLRYGAYLHDIGKLDIETAILNKEGALSDDQWEIMKNHTIWGSEMVQPLQYFKEIAPIIRSHHENYNGTGYPDGLKGKEIPLLARIVRLADSFDAMTTDRPYRKGLKFADALAEIKRCSGTIYDPELVEPFLSAMREAAIKNDSGSGEKV